MSETKFELKLPSSAKQTLDDSRSSTSKELSSAFAKYVSKIKDRVHKSTSTTKDPQVIPSVFTVYTQLLDELGKSEELNVKSNYEAFYDEYMLYLMTNENTHHGSILEIKAIAQEILQLRDRACLEKIPLKVELLANYIRFYQINGYDDTEIYTYFKHAKFSEVEKLLSDNLSSRILNNKEAKDSVPLLRKPKYIKSPKKTNMALGLYIAIINSSIPSEKGFKAFESFYRSLEVTGFREHQPTDWWEVCMYKHRMKLVNLYECLGTDLFPFLERMLFVVRGKVELDSFLNNFQFIHPRYYPFLQELRSEFPEETLTKAKSIHKILNNLGQLEEIIFELGSEYKICDYLKLMIKTESFIKIVNYIANYKIMLFKILLDISGDSELRRSKLEPHVMNRLLAARKSLKNSPLVHVFDRLIEYDLVDRRKFTDFADNPNQTHPLGMQLSKHNQFIEYELYERGINTNLAFNYPIRNKFSISIGIPEDITANLYVILESMESAFRNFQPNSLTHFNTAKEDQTRVQNILGNIKLIKNDETQEKAKQIKQLENGMYDGELANIRTQLTYLLATRKTSEPFKLRAIPINTLPEDLVVLAYRFLRQVSLFFTSRVEYIVQQWDKNQLENILLERCTIERGSKCSPADIVRCRMDKAIMMHGIYDPVTYDLVCGLWLIFVRDKNNPNDIYVLCNFLEYFNYKTLNSNKAPREILVTKLLDFAEEYTRKIGAKGLLADCEFDFNSGYEKTSIDIEIEKVGGFFALSENETKDKAKEEGSFISNLLNSTTFYLYVKSPVFQIQEKVGQGQLNLR